MILKPEHFASLNAVMVSKPIGRPIETMGEVAEAFMILTRSAQEFGNSAEVLSADFNLIGATIDMSRGPLSAERIKLTAIVGLVQALGDALMESIAHDQDALLAFQALADADEPPAL